MTNIQHGLVVSALALLWASGTASAAEPNAVGLVLKVSGQTDPDLPPREEIAANTVIKLGPGVELTFLHYPPNCELVTVVGGTLRVTKTAFTTDGEVRSQQSRPCPRVYDLSGSGGAMVARDILRLPVDPEIIFAGDRADEVTGAAIYEKAEPSRLVYRLDLADHRATPPAAATASLVPGQRYVLKLTMSDAAQAVDYTFTAVNAGAADSLVVVHVD
jgi:hypothetical protein